MKNFSVQVTMETPSDWETGKAKEYVVKQLLSTDSEIATLTVDPLDLELTTEKKGFASIRIVDKAFLCPAENDGSVHQDGQRVRVPTGRPCAQRGGYVGRQSAIS